MNDKQMMINLLKGVEVEWMALSQVFDIYAGGDVPKDAFSDKETDQFNIPILSNGINNKSLYGWTDKAKINTPSLTISARGTIGWTSYRDTPFFPIIRLLVLTPKIELNLKYAYYYMKLIENSYKVSKTGIPQLTKPMIEDIFIPIPPLPIQVEIVRILDKFTALTAELTAELSMRKKQYNYYRDQLLTFKVGEVEWMALGDLGQLIRGNGLQKKDFITEGVPAIHYGQIYTYYGLFASKTRSFVSWELAKKLKHTQCGDVLIAGTSENTKDVMTPLGWFGGDAVFSGDMYAFRPNSSIDTKYLTYTLLTTRFQQFKERYAQGTKVIRIKTDNFLKFLIPVPSISEQARIVSILDKFNTLTNSITKGLPREIELRQKQYEYYRDLLLNFPKP